MSRSTALWILPALYRFQRYMNNSYTFYHHIRFFLNLHPKVIFVLNGEQNQVYELYAVVDHFGDLRSGHYSAKIKDDNGWYKFDDSIVASVRKINLIY